MKKQKHLDLSADKSTKSAAEVLQDNPDLPAGAKQHLQAWAQGLIGDQPSSTEAASTAEPASTTSTRPA